MNNKGTFQFWHKYYLAIKHSSKPADFALSIVMYFYEGIIPTFENGHDEFIWQMIVDSLDCSRRQGRRGQGAPQGNRNSPNGRRGKASGDSSQQEQCSQPAGTMQEQESSTTRSAQRNRAVPQGLNDSSDTYLNENGNSGQQEAQPPAGAMQHTDNAELSSQQPASSQTKRGFVKPTLQEIKDYCAESGYKIDAERFVNYYDSQGWRVGKNPMRDWKAAIRSWERREEHSSAPTMQQHHPISAAKPPKQIRVEDL